MTDSIAIHGEQLWGACEIVAIRWKMPTWWAPEVAKRISQKLYPRSGVCSCDPLGGIRITISPLVLRSVARIVIDASGVDDPRHTAPLAAAISAHIEKLAMTCTCLERKPND